VLLLAGLLLTLLVVKQLHLLVLQGLTALQPCLRQVPHCQHLMLQTWRLMVAHLLMRLLQTHLVPQLARTAHSLWRWMLQHRMALQRLQDSSRRRMLQLLLRLQLRSPR
jgi:hypothetical protein